jgi:hypothetical protein
MITSKKLTAGVGPHRGSSLGGVVSGGRRDEPAVLQGPPDRFRDCCRIGFFAVAHFYFAFGWVVSVLLGLSAFILIPLLFLGRLQVRAILIMKRFQD